jgi:hypothetical protein
MRQILVYTLLLAITACAGHRRPVPVQEDLLYYSGSVAEAQQAQFLLNIVKLRYNDPVGFIDIDTLSIEDSEVLSGGLATALPLRGGLIDDSLSGAANRESAYSPQIVYGRLSGAAYANQLLEPIPARSVFMLSQSGWSVERLMMCCIARFGRLENARAVAGPPPGSIPDNRDFVDLARGLRALQLSGALRVQVIGPGTDDAGRPLSSRVVLILPDRMDNRTADLIAASGVRRADNEITLPLRMASSGDLPIQGRSLLGVMSALSLGVDVPAAHAGIVVDAGAGQPGDTCAPPAGWVPVIGDFFAVRSSPKRPEDVSMAVRHRGHWFWVDDRCADAKATLSLLTHLYALQSAFNEGSGQGQRLLLID